jgi:hypothetical protein
VPGDGRSKDRVAVWKGVRNSFKEAHLELPTAIEIARYAEFVPVREHASQTQQPAEIVRFPRDPEPRPA